VGQILGVTLGALALMLCGAAVASATTISVSTQTDGTGSCAPSGGGESCTTLRAAVNHADGDTTADTITLGAGTYQVNPGSSPSGPLVVDPAHPLTITGNGPSSTIIAPETGDAHETQLFYIGGGSVSFSGIAFENGGATGGSCGSGCTNVGEGGAIENYGALTISDSAFSGNQAIGGAWGSVSETYGDYGGEGGAIYNDGTLTVSGTTFSANAATGGGPCSGSCSTTQGGHGGEGAAIANYGSVTVSGGSFLGNEAYPGCPTGQSVAAGGPGGGSGMCTGSASGNGAGSGGNGGAVWNGGQLTLSGATLGSVSQPNIAANAAGNGTQPGGAGEGGALYDSFGVATLAGDTVTENEALGGVSTATGYAEGGSGGGVYATDDDITIAGGTFSSNTAGGGQEAAGSNAGEGGQGGAVECYYCSLTVTGNGSGPATFASNIAVGGQANAANTQSGNAGYGGAIYSQDGGVQLSDATFNTNQAQAGGAATSGTYDAAGAGGAIYENGSISGSDLGFTGNLAGANNANPGFAGGYGGAVYVGSGSASFAGSTFTSNSAQPGGTSDGEPEGGAIYDEAGAADALSEDSFTSNTALGGSGGAVDNNGVMTLTASTLSANSARYGGAIAAYDVFSAITNTTIDGNTAAGPASTYGQGGGIYAETDLQLANDSLVGNSAYGNGDGGNLYVLSQFLALHDTLIADGTLTGPSLTSNYNCYIGTVRFEDLGYNAEDAKSDPNECDLSAGSGDLVDSSSLDASLGSLASNGGPTQTVALASGSPAVNAGDPAGCTDAAGNALTSDQRGDARPAGGRCDIGAFEYQPPPPPPPPPPAPASPPAPVAPVLSGLGFSPQLFLAVTDGGSTIVYSDSEAGVTSFTVTGTIPGYKSHQKGAKCKALPASGKLPKRSSKCTISGTFDTFSHQDVAGSNTVLFSGFASGKALPAGSYTLSASPVFDGLTGASATTTFKIA
jgi:hypothetical protein